MFDYFIPGIPAFLDDILTSTWCPFVPIPSMVTAISAKTGSFNLAMFNDPTWVYSIFIISFLHLFDLFCKNMYNLN